MSITQLTGATMPNYKVITSRSPDDLERKINEFLSSESISYGELIAFSSHFVQRRTAQYSLFSAVIHYELRQGD